MSLGTSASDFSLPFCPVLPVTFMGGDQSHFSTQTSEHKGCKIFPCEVLVALNSACDMYECGRKCKCYIWCYILCNFIIVQNIRTANFTFVGHKAYLSVTTMCNVFGVSFKICHGEHIAVMLYEMHAT